MKKILVIDNQASIRESFVKGLKAKGFYATAAENGLVGIEQVQQELPDLIVSETIMPKLDGYNLLEILRNTFGTAIIPFIFVSHKATRADIRKGMKLGADDYLTKPCTVEELIETITALLEKQATFKKSYAAQFGSFKKLAESKSAPGNNAQTQQGLGVLQGEMTKSTAVKSIFPSLPHLNDIFDFIDAHYDQPITLNSVAQSFGYSSAYLTDLVRRQTGHSLYRWIVKRRMTAACSLLLETDRSIECITEAIGYRNTWCFFRQFRKEFGVTPGEWRSANRN